MKACTSSMITNLREANMGTSWSWWLEMMFCRDSGVICSMPEGLSKSFLLALCPTSPCHPVTLIPESRSR